LTRELLSNLPEVAVEPNKVRNTEINVEYALIECRYSLDGKLWALFADRFQPLPIQDAEILQWRRQPDGMQDGMILASLDISDQGNTSEQAAYFIPARQRTESDCRSCFGAVLVPVNNGYGVLYNEDPESLLPSKKRRQPFTRYSFAWPTLAYVQDGELRRKTLDIERPYPFGVLFDTRSQVVTPFGHFVNFRTLELGFSASKYFHFWPNYFETSSKD
jgi:hypothetical protein